MEVWIAITRQEEWHPGEMGAWEMSRSLGEGVNEGQEYLYSFLLKK